MTHDDNDARAAVLGQVKLIDEILELRASRIRKLEEEAAQVREAVGGRWYHSHRGLLEHIAEQREKQLKRARRAEAQRVWQCWQALVEVAALRAGVIGVTKSALAVFVAHSDQLTDARGRAAELEAQLDEKHAKLVEVADELRDVRAQLADSVTWSRLSSVLEELRKLAAPDSYETDCGRGIMRAVKAVELLFNTAPTLQEALRDLPEAPVKMVVQIGCTHEGIGLPGCSTCDYDLVSQRKPAPEQREPRQGDTVRHRFGGTAMFVGVSDVYGHGHWIVENSQGVWLWLKSECEIATPEVANESEAAS